MGRFLAVWSVSEDVGWFLAVWGAFGDVGWSLAVWGVSGDAGWFLAVWSVSGDVGVVFGGVRCGAVGYDGVGRPVWNDWGCVKNRWFEAGISRTATIGGRLFGNDTAERGPHRSEFFIF